MKKHYLYILILLIFPSILLAQTINGSLIDKQGNKIEEAYVFHTKTGNHVHTNHVGQFTMHNVKQGDTLLVIHIGYESKYVYVKDIEEELEIELKEKIISLDEIIVSTDLNAINILSEIDIKTEAVNSSQEILRKLPGLVIGQHAGGGKAEQIFLRGFDIDHGTDINISVDGVPVNMVSHAHGQGYADLHFLIPETVDNICFGKGPYYTDKGNFTTAGYVDFSTKERLDNSIVKIEAGQYNSQRLLSMFEVLKNESHSLYIASEYMVTDGYFESPQNFNRLNIMAKYTGTLSNNDKISVNTSYFSSKWNASGQIPQRAIDNNSISRFGAIDDTEGGQTDRTNVSLQYTKKISKDSYFKSNIYYSTYHFELYSNFTFFLNDSINGDQIKQKEARELYGVNSEYLHSLNIGSSNLLLRTGIGFRKDESIDNELSHTANREQTLNNIKFGDINETNSYAYTSASLEVGKWTINPGIRIDRFMFNYNDHLLGYYATQSEDESIISPKLNVLFNPSNSLQIYLKTGKGFHSNDTRVVVAQTGEEVLAAAWGSDVGFLWKPFSKIFINTAAWYLYLEQEFVYVGDEGIVEPSGKSQRMGLDFSIRYQVFKYIFWDADVNYTIARALEEIEGEDYIPLAPDLVITSGLKLIHPSKIYASANFRYIKNRPANEDMSIIAKGYQVLDINAGYQWKSLDFGVNIQNVLNTEWNETQFATTSRLQNEIYPVEEIHFIPGSPFFIKGYVAYKF
jgi:outer membrane receptor for Fe3+-dicitrate